MPLRPWILLLCALPLPAQTQPSPAFDVISIKPTPGQPVNSGFRRASPGMLNTTNITVKMLIGFAYDVRDDQISGGPGWLETAHFEIVAKPGEGEDARTAAKLVKARTQAMLRDRFHLIFHRGTKELPVLVLTVARNGPKGLHPSTVATPDFVNNGHHLNAQGLSVSQFATMFLAGQTRRSVMDKTGIEGQFDFTLDWMPDDAPSDAAASGPDLPGLFGAVQEQLGLKLEQGRGPVDVLIIDGAEHPAEN